MTPMWRSVVIWVVLLGGLIIPLGMAAQSPQLAWRDPIYIIAGLMGVSAFGLMLVQPLMVIGNVPGLAGRRGCRVHQSVGVILIVLVIGHVIGVWITSPPDVIDALLFRSPTPFSIWGVLAMWAAFAAAALATFRARVSTRIWRLGHTVLIVSAAIGTVLHALLIDGTMEAITKIMLCVLVIAATAKAILARRVWMVMRRRG